MVQQNAFQIQFQPSDAILSVRTALAYKYKPTVRYSVELFRNDPQNIRGTTRFRTHTECWPFTYAGSFLSIMGKIRKPLLVRCLPCGVSAELKTDGTAVLFSGRKKVAPMRSLRKHQFLHPEF